MVYLLLLPLIASVKVLTQGRLIKSKTNSLRDVFLVNGCIFCASALVCAIIYRLALPTQTEILYGVLLAVGNMMLQVGYGIAFRVGSVSLSTTINSFNIALPILMRVLFFREMLSAFQLAGLFCLSVAFILISYKKGESGGSKWLFFTLLAFFGSGFSNCILSLLSQSKAVNGKEGCLVCAYLLAGLISLTVSLCLPRKDTPDISGKGSLCIGILLVGLMLGLYNVLLVRALNVLGTVIVYPTTGVMTTASIALGDRIFFRNHFNKKQLWGMLFAAMAVAFLNL